MSKKKQLSNKEKYDAEIQEINKTISLNKNNVEKEAGLSDEDIEELDVEVEVVEEVMEELDKHVGEIKEPTTHTMTADQHLNRKVEEQRKKVLEQFVGGQKPVTLKPEEHKKMTKILELVNNGKCKDPVLNHLVEQKLDLATAQVILSTKVKEMQLEIIERMSDLTTKVTENQNSTNTYNRDILIYVQKNPKLLAE